MLPSSRLSLLALVVVASCHGAIARPPRVALLRLRGGIEATWTPNGEAPAPFSTRARQQMGMDPGAMAGGAQPGPGGGGSRLGLSMAAVIYLCNNWTIAVALRALLMKLLAPLLKALGSRRQAAAQQAQAAAKKQALAARKARLKAAAARKTQAAKDDEEE